MRLDIFNVAVFEFHLKIYTLQLVDNHIVNGRVSTAELDNDLVGESLSNTKLRSNVYITEDQDWKEVKVSPLRLNMPGFRVSYTLDQGFLTFFAPRTLKGQKSF